MSESAQGQAVPVVTNPNPVNELAAKYWQYILDNPVKSAMATVLFWGGLLLLMFFLHIGFMPDVNLESVSSLLYAVALFGGFITAYSALLMVLPGLVMAELRSTVKFLQFRHLLATEVGATLSWAAFILYFFGYAHLSSAWILCIGTVILVPLICLVIDLRKPTVSRLRQLAPSANKTKIPTINFYERRLSKLKTKLPSNDWDAAKINQAVEFQRLRRRLPTYFWTAGMVAMNTAVLAPSLLFVGIIGLTGDIRTTPAIQVVLLLVAMTLLIALSGAVIGDVKTSEKFKVSVVFALVLLFLVMLTTGGFSTFSVIAIKSLGQGEINAARITVTGKTCKEINQTLGQRVCADVPDEDVTAICPVRVRSRIGSQVLLEFAPMITKTDKSGVESAMWVISTNGTSNTKQEQKLIRRVILEKSKMLGWQPLQNFGEEPPENSSNATILPIASIIERTKKQAGNVSRPTEADALIRTLRNRCGEESSAPQNVSTGAASVESKKSKIDRIHPTLE